MIFQWGSFKLGKKTRVFSTCLKRIWLYVRLFYAGLFANKDYFAH